ncbi:MAG: hypothetical protein IJA02_02095 [Clostridia bacterium]|nr:hypothetical protein [Clostridia bacterium]
MLSFKRLFSFALVLVMLLSSVSLWAFAQEAESYYIDAIDGDDENSGTEIDSPVKTIGGLKELNIGPGTKFLFRRGGKYECAATLTCSGTKENPVVISSYGEGEDAVLYTNEKTDVLRLFDCSYITVSDLHIKAPNGGGIWIDTYNQTSEGIVIENVLFEDMQNHKVHSRDDFQNGAAGARAAVMVKGLPAKSRYAVNDLTIKNCEVYNCGNGFIIWGSWNDEQSPWCENEEDIDPVYNEGLLIKDCYLHEMDAEAVVVGMCDGALVTHCRAINCCQGEGVDENGEIEYFTAAMWFWGSENSTIQFCEIAGQKNIGDGMAVDFDSHTNNCTYQYIYSHDNMRFMCNCPNYSGHHNNTVRYCLSVNDNGGRSTTAVGKQGEHGFKFYNNTIINCGEFQIMNLYDAVIANNIIIPETGKTIAYNLEPSRNNIFKNNCYYDVMTPLVDLGAMNTVPGFAGEDYEEFMSFVLSSDSPLIGAGAAVEGDDSQTDFYGNKITSRNIGCYGGEGVDAEYKAETFLEKIIRTIRNIFETVKHEIEVIIEDL